MKLLNTDCSVPEISSLLDELVSVKTEYTATFLSVNGGSYLVYLICL